MLLSIIIPCYNSALYIKQTIDSIIMQNKESLEIILVNDGSTDSTLSILDDYKSKNDNVVVIDQNNRGVSIARNEGLKVAKGKYVCYLDSDDLFTQETIQYFFNVMNIFPNVDLLCFGYQSKRENGTIKRMAIPRHSNMLFSSADFLSLFLERNIYVHIGSFLVKRDLLLSKSILFLPNCKIGEDIRFIIQMIQSANSVYYDSRVCFSYIVRPNSTMKGYKSFEIQNFSLYNVIEDMNIIFSRLNDSKMYFLAVTYVSLLVRYLRYGSPNRIIETYFIDKSSILLKPLPRLSLYYFAILIFGCIPKKILFTIKNVLVKLSSI